MRTSLTVNELEAFLHVADTRNFRLAAERFHVTQPALTRIIQNAERKLTTQLFDRNTRRVELTRSGEQLLPIARRIVGEFHDSLSELSEFVAGRSGHVTIACLPSVAAAVLPEVLRVFGRAHPKVRFTVQPLSADFVLAEVLSGQADFGMSIAPPPRSDVSYEPLLLDELVLICRRDDPLAAQAQVPWTVFAQREHIVSGPASSVRELVDNVAYEGKSYAPARYQCTNITVTGVMVATGLGISAVPRTSLRLIDMRELAAVPLQAPVVSREIGLLTRTGRSLSAAAIALIDELRAIRTHTDGLEH